MDKLDLAKTDKTYFTARAVPKILEIGPAAFLSVCGQGDPSGDPFAEKVQALYTVAYALKFSRKAEGKDFVVSKLEGLWWYDETKYSNISGSEAPVQIPRSEWSYRLLIRIPDDVQPQEIEQVLQTVRAKKDVAGLTDVAHFQMHEGTCVQMLHQGPFEKEPETLAVMMAFIQENKLGRNGLHHEIYLSDFRRTAPEQLKTILREPVLRP